MHISQSGSTEREGEDGRLGMTREALPARSDAVPGVLARLLFVLVLHLTSICVLRDMRDSVFRGSHSGTCKEALLTHVQASHMKRV